MTVENRDPIRKVSVILATYNERENILLLIDAISERLKGRDIEFVVVDDDSPDRTWECVHRRSLKDPRVRLLRRIDERGLTSALNAGIEIAEGNVVVWLDCDFQHPPEKLPELLAELETGCYDVVIGSRFLNKERRDLRLESASGQPRIVRFHGFLSVVISRVTQAALRVGVTDWTSGLIAIKREIVRQQPLVGDYGEYFVELMYRLVRSGYRLQEIPYTLGVRQRGESKSSASYWSLFAKGTKCLRVVLTLAAEDRGFRRPGKAIGT